MIPEATWEELALELKRQMDAEKTPRPENLPTDKDGLLRELSKHQPRLDDICGNWVLTGKWNIMLPVEAWLLRFRLFHGWKLALRLTRPHANGETLAVPYRPIALRWLIADSWLNNDTEELAQEAYDALQNRRALPPRLPGLG